MRPLRKSIALLSNTLGHLSALRRSGSRILIPLLTLCSHTHWMLGFGVSG